MVFFMLAQSRGMGGQSYFFLQKQHKDISLARPAYVCGAGWYVMAITGVDNIHNMSESIMCMVIYHIICTLTIFFLMQQRWFCYSLTYSDFHLALLLLVSETEMDYMPYMTISRLIFSTNYQVSQPDYILRRATLWVTWKVLSIKIPLSREGVMICFLHQNIVRDQM